MNPNYRIWWLNPGALLTLALLPFAIVAYTTSDADYISTWGAHRYITTQHFVMVIICLLAFYAGGGFSIFFPARQRQGHWGKFEPSEVEFLLNIFNMGYLLIIVAYVIWSVILVRNGLSIGLIRDTLAGDSGAVYEMSDTLITLPGVTTATQFAMAIFTIGTILYFNGQARRVLWKLIALFIITVVRSFVVSERLAIIEVAVPTLILVIYYKRADLRRFLVGYSSVALPVVAVVGLYLIFTGMEYFRSWSVYEDSGLYDSLWQFTFLRLVCYYTTALNNGAMVLKINGPPGFPITSLDWLLKFPVIGPAITPQHFSPEDNYYLLNDTLTQFANPEFNNCSGIFSYEMDWGSIGTPILFFILGFIAFSLYKRFVAGTAGGLLLYPFFCIGLLEMARVAYWTASRAFPTWLLLIATTYSMARIYRRLTDSQLPAS